MLRQHGHHAVHKIDTRCTLSGLPVDYTVGLHIMRDVRDMDTYFVIATGHTAHAQSIVKVFCIARVNGKGNNATHILTLGHNLGGNTRINFISGLFHCGRINVRQAVFGKYGMYFGVILARGTEHIKHFSVWYLLVFRPFRDADYSFFACAAATELVSRNHDVGGEEL